MKCALSVLGALTAAASFAAPVVSDVVVSQDAATRRVKVEYSLQDDPAIITVAFRTNGQLVAEKDFTTVVGDVNRLVKPADAHELYWQPERDLVDFATTDFSAEVTAWALDNPPWYMDIELGKTAGLIKRFYVSSNAVPGGVTDRRYKTTHLLMRRIPARDLVWCMGGEGKTEHLVMLTDDYYIGVYEFTQKQYQSIGFGVTSDHFDGSKYAEWETMPRSTLDYNTIRGSASATPKIDWPDTKATVGDNSVLGKLRDYTGIPTFDLPTEAQWEYAYRAGMSTDLYSGPYNAENAKAIAWCIDNSKDESTGENAPRPVGLKPANKWGIYDIAGNISEWCRDWQGDYDLVSDTYVATNPPGPATGENRIIRAGNYLQGVGLVRAFYRYGYKPANNYTSTAGYIGFRVVCDAVIPAE